LKLVIAEKKSVAESIAKVLNANKREDGYFITDSSLLDTKKSYSTKTGGHSGICDVLDDTSIKITEGGGYIVSWCVGHLVGLADAYEYDERYGKWRREDLPIVPADWKYVIFDAKRKQFNILRSLMNRKDVDRLVCATDAGREGELIYRFVYLMAGCKKPFKRLWISSMEESAIKAGFANLKDGSDRDPLYYSALCRAKADWLIGINATRLFSTLYGKTLNVGRVQTPTLAMLTARSAAVSGFVKEKYYLARLNLDTEGGGIAARSAKIPAADEAEKIRAAADGKTAVCVSLTKERKTVPPPKLFDLTALQRESNRLFGLTAQQTLDAAQKLYEAKLLTYPRTDSRCLTSDMAVMLPGLVNAGAAFIGAGDDKPPLACNTAQVINDAKVSDHHAIIPTAELAKTDISKLPEPERRLLSLVSSRLVCAVGEKHVYEAVTAVLDCGGHSFTAKGKTVIADGWKAIETRFISVPKLKDADAGTEDGGALPPIAEGQTFNNAAAAVTEHYTKPPAPYTEDTLLAAMESAGASETNEDAERKGLGTPATRAAVIEKLVNGGFVARRGKQLIPTPDGETLIKILPDTLTSPALTSEWENALTLIAKGRERPDSFMRGIEDMARSLVGDNAAPIDEYKQFFGERENIGKCPRCGGNVVESKKNFHCESGDCGFVMWKTDRFFTSRKKELTKQVAAELLKTGKAKVRGMYSEKKGKTFDAVVLLADTGGKYVNYRFDIPDGDGGSSPGAE
jgi:DNA topoisomerase-3